MGVAGLLAALRTLVATIEPGVEGVDGESRLTRTLLDVIVVGAVLVEVVRPRVIGCSWPLGMRKQGVSGAGSPGAASTEAPRTSEYGTMMMGFVGSARQGCGGGESPGLELVGGEPLSEEALAEPLPDALAPTVGVSFTTCLVLQ